MSIIHTALLSCRRSSPDTVAQRLESFLRQLSPNVTANSSLAVAAIAILVSNNSSPAGTTMIDMGVYGGFTSAVEAWRQSRSTQTGALGAFYNNLYSTPSRG